MNRCNRLNTAGTMPPRRCGVTLLELIVSLSIVGILMAGAGSAIMIASRAIDDGTSPAARTSEAREVLDRIMADAQFALNVSERTPNAVTFTVPDRNGDALPESIRYAWSGVEDDPLTLEYNGGSAVTIAEDAQQFDLTYLLLTTGPPPPPPEVESEEILLIVHNDAPGSTEKQCIVRAYSWCAQYFLPPLPTNALSWSITRVKLHLGRSGAVRGSSSVEIRSGDASQVPTSTVLDAVLVPEESLPGTPMWVDVVFNSLTGLDPSAGVCLLVRGMSGPQFTATVSFEENGSPMTPDTHYVFSFAQGDPWSTPNDTQDMRFYVYGTVTTDGEAEWP